MKMIIFRPWCRYIRNYLPPVDISIEEQHDSEPWHHLPDYSVLIVCHSFQILWWVISPKKTEALFSPPSRLDLPSALPQLQSPVKIVKLTKSIDREKITLALASLAASASAAMALWSWIGSLTSFLHTFWLGKWQFWVWTMIQFFVNVISFCEKSKVKFFITSLLHMYCFGNFENLLSYVCLLMLSYVCLFILWNQKCLILSSFQINCLLCHFVFVWRFLTSRLVQLWSPTALWHHLATPVDQHEGKKSN